MNLNKLLKPKSIAVIGASERAGFGGDTCRNILDYRKDLSRVYFVHPKRESVFGHPCHNSLDAIEDTIDLAIICTPQSTVEDILKQAAQKGCGGAVVFASGYSETGAEGKQRQENLVALCDKLDIALMGPNCAGFANYVDNVFSFAFLTEKRERKGKIGLISQSGQICLSALDSPNLGFSYLISSGNSANIKVEDYIRFLVEDEDTSVVAAYLEGIAKADVFVDALKKAAEKKKPVVILKSGRSQKSSELAASHTGSLSGSDKAIDAVFDKFGVIRANDVQELLSTASLFSTLNGLPAGTRYAALNVSGGEAGITADIAHLNSVELSDLSEAAKAELNAIMPSYATANNPLDMTASLAYDPERLAQAIGILAKQDNVDVILIGYTITLEIIDTTVPSIINGIALAKEAGLTKPVLWLPFVEHTKNQVCADDLYAMQVPILPSGMSGMNVLGHLDSFVRYDNQTRTLDLLVSEEEESKGTISFSESESMKLLSDSGLDIPESAVVSNLNEVERICDEMGFPLVLKIDSPDILHKSDIGGVKLNIKDKAEAIEAYKEILRNAKIHCPDARINGVLFRPMAKKGMEMIVGVNNDKQFGPMIMIGLGGVFVEVFKDTALYPAPLSKAEAGKMLKSLKGYKLLNGYRGGERCDIDALEDFIVGISEFAADNRNSLKELDINPVFVYPENQGLEIIDALVIKHKN